MSEELGVNTPEGHQAGILEAFAICGICIRKNWDWVATKREGDKPVAAVDGFYIWDGFVQACYESKVRFRLNEKTFFHHPDWMGRLLLTDYKVPPMQTICRLLKVDGYVVAYLVDSRLALMKRLVDVDGLKCDAWDVKNTKTKKWIRGGKAWRDNAFIDMNDAERFYL